MKQLNLSAIASGINFPFKKGTGVFLQDAYTEITASAIINLIGNNYNTSIAYILCGCNQTDIGTEMRFEEGAIFLNGIVYLSPFQLVPYPAGADVYIANFLVSQYTTNADPVTFSDLVPRNVHDITTVQYTTGATTTGTIDDYDNFIDIGGIDVYPTYSGTYTQDASNPILFSRIRDRIYMKGVSDNITPASTSISDTIFNLPVKYRPSKTVWTSIIDSSTGGSIPIQITTSGDVIARGDLITFYNVGLYFTGLSFSL